MKIFFLLFHFVALYLYAGQNNGTNEQLWFYSDDLSSAMSYTSQRSLAGVDARFLFNEGYDKKLIHYARPKGYRWERDRDNGTTYESLNFGQTATYGFLRNRSDSSEFFTKEEGGELTLKANGNSCIGEECYFEEAIVSAVIPKRYKVKSYKAKRDGELCSGEWKVVDHTYTFYRTNSQGCTLWFTLEDTAPKGFEKVQTRLKTLKGVSASFEGNLVKVTLPVESMFASGSATLEEVGMRQLTKVIVSFGDIAYKEIRVEGHTDNVPTTGKYLSNWELSSARASNVVKYMCEKNFDPKFLVAMGYADARPLESNLTPEGRAKNRRIEFTLVTEPIK